MSHDTSFRGALSRMQSPEEMDRINAPWGGDGDYIYDASDIAVAYMSHYHVSQVSLVTAAPELLNALRGLVGLTELLRLRDDLPMEVTSALTSSHRVRDAIAAIAQAENKGETNGTR